jgi:low temperature requirement protein LtrA
LFFNFSKHKVKTSEDDADASKHLGVLKKCTTQIYVYIHIYIYIYICVCVCGAFGGIDNKLNKNVAVYLVKEDL